MHVVIEMISSYFSTGFLIALIFWFAENKFNFRKFLIRLIKWPLFLFDAIEEYVSNHKGE